MNALLNTAAPVAMGAPVPPPLNQGQSEAAEAFFQFLFSDQKEMNISGPGGVGKTFLMGHLIDVILPRYHETCRLMGIQPEYDSVEMTATTNKAAEALGEATNRPTQTIHSFLSLKVTDDYTTGKQKLKRTSAWKPHLRTIIFVDEASMIDTALLEEIRGSTMNCKIVYVGDHCQLAPVGESLSPVYLQNIPTYHLLEPMRTSIPELHAFNQQLRNTVETGIFQPIKLVPGIIDWLDDAAAERLIAQTFAQQTRDSRILAYTNKRVIEFNDHIRQDVRQLHHEFTPGELLVNNSAVQLKDYMLSVEEEVEILSQAASTEKITIEDGVELEVRKTNIRTKHGGSFRDILLPVNRDHFSALLTYYGKLRNWERLFFLKNKFPDLRQREAATVHKAQGSTYNTVIIDLGNISTCNIPSQVARMLYVAGSRARYRVFLYGKLAEKYGGLIH